MDKKRLFPAILVLVTAMSIYYMIDRKQSSASTYQQYLEAARAAAEEHILVDAQEYYQKAMELSPSLALSLEIGEMYISLEEYQEAAYWYDRQLKDVYPRDADTYVFGIRTAIRRERYAEAFRIFDTMTDRGLKAEEADALIESIQYAFSLTERFQDVSAFSNLSGMAAVLSEDRWGYIGRDGGWEISNLYQAAGLMGDTAPVLSEDGEAYFIDQGGYRKLNASFYEEGDPGFGKIKAFLGEESGLVLASNGEEVGFFYTDNGDKAFGNFQSATIVSNDICAATENGDSWALIDSQGNPLTEYQFQSVLTDKKGNPCRTQAIIVKENNRFYLVDRTGQRITEQSYDDADAFNDNTLAAVKKNGKWIFVDESGMEVDLGTFQCARSFSNGMAAIEIDNKWGYIDREGRIVIEPQFEEADPISPLGVGFVKTDNGVWQMLSLYSQNHEE